MDRLGQERKRIYGWAIDGVAGGLASSLVPKKKLKKRKEIRDF
jgi:hypothetical protein